MCTVRRFNCVPGRAIADRSVAGGSAAAPQRGGSAAEAASPATRVARRRPGPSTARRGGVPRQFGRRPPRAARARAARGRPPSAARRRCGRHRRPRVRWASSSEAAARMPAIEDAIDLRGHGRQHHDRCQPAMASGAPEQSLRAAGRRRLRSSARARTSSSSDELLALTAAARAWRPTARGRAGQMMENGSRPRHASPAQQVSA